MKILATAVLLFTLFGCSFKHTPKFKVGDCYQSKYRNFERWESDIRLVSKVLEVGVAHYRTVCAIGELTSNYNFTDEISFTDETSVLVPCPKILEDSK